MLIRDTGRLTLRATALMTSSFLIVLSEVKHDQERLFRILPIPLKP
jgi:hypothetical protein